MSQLWKAISSLSLDVPSLKLGKWPYFEALFSAVSIDIHLLLFIKSFLKRVEGFPISPLGYKPHSRFAFLEFSLLCSLRKQPTFGDVTTGFPAKWRLRNKRRNSILRTRHYSDLGSASDWLNQIFPRATTNQKHYRDLGGDASSVWNFCARFSHVIWCGNQF